MWTHSFVIIKTIVGMNNISNSNIIKYLVSPKYKNTYCMDIPIVPRWNNPIVKVKNLMVWVMVRNSVYHIVNGVS